MSISRPLPRQAFIAFWFNSQWRSVCEDGLRQGVREAGYDPFIVDRKQFLGKVDDKIIAEIRRSHFLVADLSGQRPNVYFEAGFAEGLDLPVVYTCCACDLENCHFDKRQENIIVWRIREDLTEALHLRIEATMGRPAELPHA